MKHVTFLLLALGFTLHATPMYNINDLSKLCNTTELRLEQEVIVKNYATQFALMHPTNHKELKTEVQAFADFIIANDISLDSYNYAGSTTQYREDQAGQKYEKCVYCGNYWRAGEPCPKPSCPLNIWKNRSKK